MRFGAQCCVGCPTSTFWQRWWPGLIRTRILREDGTEGATCSVEKKTSKKTILWLMFMFSKCIFFNFSFLISMYRVSRCYSWSDIKSKRFIWFSLKLNRQEKLSSFIPLNPDTLQFFKRERESERVSCSWLCNFFWEILIFAYTSLLESRQDLRVERTSSSFHLFLFLLFLLFMCGRRFYEI